MSTPRILLLLFMLLAAASFFYFDAQQYLSLSNLKTQQTALQAYCTASPLKAMLWYMLLYIVVTGLSLPGATVLTLAGGALFGLFWGSLLVSFASSIGATLAFLSARFLLRDWVQTRFAQHMQALNAGIAAEGAWYLFMLRLAPLFPFVVINLLMGLTFVPTLTFYWVSQVGMLAGTVVYVNAGTQLAQVNSLADILSPPLLASLVLLACFPYLAKKLVEHLPRGA